MESTAPIEDTQAETDLRYNRWNPEDYAAEQDQHHPGVTFMQNYKTSLLATEKSHATNRLLDSLDQPCLQELTIPGVKVDRHQVTSLPAMLMPFQTQPSWPLSAFTEDIGLSSDHDIQHLYSIGLSQFGPYCPCLQDVCLQDLSPGHDYFSLALATVGAALQDSPCRTALWMHANRTLTSTLAINNKRLREPKAHTAVR